MLIYKVFVELDFDLFIRNDGTSASVSDVKDGFIHLSKREQLPQTIKRYFSKQDLIFVSAFRESDLAHKLRWELSKNLEVFPHYYGYLRPSQVIYTIRLEPQIHAKIPLE